MKRFWFALLMVSILFGLWGIFAPGGTLAASTDRQISEPTPTPEAQPTPGYFTTQGQAVDTAVAEALQKAIAGNNAKILAFQAYEVVVGRIEYSKDVRVALLYLDLKDPLTGEILATEPGLAVARNATNGDPTESANWQTTLQNMTDWYNQLTALPPELLSDDLRQRFLEGDGAKIQPQAGLPVFTGYKLPWAAGLEKRITGSIGHFLTYRSCPETCRYAYDFADGTMFPLLASKGGTVKSYRVGCANGDTNCTNFLVLEDQSTTPTTYQVYYHMAYNTLPQRLRVIGTPVLQGEYIGDVDDTGYSSGHHLHYHVFTTPNKVNWEWGISVDFIYDDVKMNGGHLRTCSEATNFPQYGTECNAGPDGRRGTADDDRLMSQNTPAHPPTGNVIVPVNRQVVNSQTLLVGGTASVDPQTVKAQVFANWNNAWHLIDNNITIADGGIFSKEVDLCSANVPDGPVELSVKIFGRDGSQAFASPGNIQIIKNFSCQGIQVPPAPACTPNDNQVALYADPDYRGACKRFDLPSDPNQFYSAADLGAVGDNNAASIQVGKNVRAVLYDFTDDLNQTIPEGRTETRETNDANLSDNLIGIDHVSGLFVEARTAPPDEPFLFTPGRLSDGSANPTSVDSLVLSWNGGVGATSFGITLNGPGYNNTSWTVMSGSSLPIGTLAPGKYNWKVQARNSAGTNTTELNFTVDAASLPASDARGIPFQDNVDAGPNDWVATGLWRRDAAQVGGATQPTQAWIYNNGTHYSGPPNRAGDLTSPPISIPSSGGPYYLRFRYFGDVEDGSPFWDQRRVQVIDANGKVTELYQLSDDKQMAGQFWLASPPLSLANFAGKVVRLRFHFDAIDTHYNNTQGWIIDDISVTNQGTAAGCTDSDSNSINNSVAIAVGDVVSGATICPEGDVDYYKFSGTAGQPIVIDIDAQPKGSQLDAQVYLLDADKQSVIAFSDDTVLGEQYDPLLAYTLQRSGTYYVKVKAWDYPGAGSTAHFYDLRLKQVQPTTPKSISLLYPTNPKRIPSGPFEIVASAQDTDGGPVAQVEFYWHGPDWATGTWVKLGVDTNGSDGWSYILYPLLYGDVRGSALYVQARNAAGAALGTALWDLEPDAVTPASQLYPIPAQTGSTVIGLKWVAEDPQNDIAYFEFQYQQLEPGKSWSGWQDWANRPNGIQRQAWFVGLPGFSYRFHMRAVDAAGNVEDYLDGVEAVTTLQSVCLPDQFDEKDSTIEGAQALAAGQVRNFCSGDVDWISFQIQEGQTVSQILAINPLGGGAAFQANLYNANREFVVSGTSPDFGASVAYLWDVMPAGIYYLELRPLNAGLYGTDVRYGVIAGPSLKSYFPNISK